MGLKSAWSLSRAYHETSLVRPMCSRDGRCESKALAGRFFPDLGHALERPFLFLWMSRLEDRLRPSERAHQERGTVGVGQSEGRDRRASMQRMVL